MPRTDDLGGRIRVTPREVLAERIKQARTEAGLTHDKLGSRIGTSRQHLIKLEKAQHRPRAGMLRRIAKATDQPTDWFLEPENAPE